MNIRTLALAGTLASGLALSSCTVDLATVNALANAACGVTVVALPQLPQSQSVTTAEQWAQYICSLKTTVFGANVRRGRAGAAIGAQRTVRTPYGPVTLQLNRR